MLSVRWGKTANTIGLPPNFETVGPSWGRSNIVEVVMDTKIFYHRFVFTENSRESGHYCFLALKAIATWPSSRQRLVARRLSQHEAEGVFIVTGNFVNSGVYFEPSEP